MNKRTRVGLRVLTVVSITFAGEGVVLMIYSSLLHNPVEVVVAGIATSVLLGLLLALHDQMRTR